MPLEPALRRIIGGFRASPNWDKELDVELLRKLWPDLVGESIAGAVSIMALEGSRLILHVTDRTWQRELFRMRQHLLRKVNEPWPTPWIKEIAFVHHENHRN